MVARSVSLEEAESPKFKRALAGAAEVRSKSAIRAAGDRMRAKQDAKNKVFAECLELVKLCHSPAFRGLAALSQDRMAFRSLGRTLTKGGVLKIADKADDILKLAKAFQ